MASKNKPILKRCRALGIEPIMIGYDKQSKKKPRKGNRKVSEYGTQLKEKQKVKFVYGVSEKQFRKYFKMASDKKGITGENLLQILESRIDNVVYRLGFAASRAQARQFVSHAQFELNGKKVNIPSILVKEGDVISLREAKKENATIKVNVEETSKNPITSWLERDTEKVSGKVIRLSSREDIDIDIEEHLIVELYSK